MATEIWLGPAGSEVLLPPVNWIGEPGEYPETYKKNFETATMLGGKIRYNFLGHSQRSWALAWAMIGKAQVDALQALFDARVHLRFKNGMTASPEWTTVAMTVFSVSPLLETFRPGMSPKFSVMMSLEEEG